MVLQFSLQLQLELDAGVDVYQAVHRAAVTADVLMLLVSVVHNYLNVQLYTYSEKSQNLSYLRFNLLFT